MAERGVPKKYEAREVQLEIPDDVLVKLRKLIESLPWVRAKSYEETFPHEYGQKRKLPNAELLPHYRELAMAIPTYGYRFKSKVGTWTYLDIDGYKYWTGWQNHSEPDWINRVKESESKV